VQQEGFGRKAVAVVKIFDCMLSNAWKKSIVAVVNLRTRLSSRNED